MDEKLRKRELAVLSYCDTRAREMMSRLGELEVKFMGGCEIQDFIRLSIADVVFHFLKKYKAFDGVDKLNKTFEA